MIRKQVYIEPRQERMLKERAAAYGVTEAELIRRSLDRGVGGLGTPAPDPAAWEEIERFIARRSGARGRRTRRRWTRDALHDR